MLGGNKKKRKKERAERLIFSCLRFKRIFYSDENRNAICKWKRHNDIFSLTRQVQAARRGRNKESNFGSHVGNSMEFSLCSDWICSRTRKLSSRCAALSLIGGNSLNHRQTATHTSTPTFSLVKQQQRRSMNLIIFKNKHMKSMHKHSRNADIVWVIWASVEFRK